MNHVQRSRSKLYAAVLLAFCLAGARPADAQTQPAAAPRLSTKLQTPQAVEPNLPGRTERGAAPGFRLFGLPVLIQAPVPAPYTASAYSNFGGQPQRGTDATLAQTTNGR